jgi:hypothetical protein
VSKHRVEEAVLLNFKLNQGSYKKLRARGLVKLSLPLALALAPIGALSDQLVWVLGSFSDADTAQQVAREVHDLTGQSGYVQTAEVNGRGVYRALIDPGVTDDAQARTMALLSETSYSQTWGFELDTDGKNVARIGAVVMNQARDAAVAPGLDQKDSEPRPVVQAAADLIGGQAPRMAQRASADRNKELRRPSPHGDAMGAGSDYHPIRLKSDR